MLSALNSALPSDCAPEVGGLHLGRNCVLSVHLPNSHALQCLSEKPLVFTVYSSTQG